MFINYNLFNKIAIQVTEKYIIPIYIEKLIIIYGYITYELCYELINNLEMKKTITLYASFLLLYHHLLK